MAVITDVYTITGAVVEGAGTFDIDGVQSMRMDPQSRQLLLRSNGNPFSSALVFPGHEPVFDLSTLSVDKYLRNAGLYPVAVDSALPFTGIKMAFQKTKFGELREPIANINHQVVDIARATMFLQSVRATANDAAIAQIRIQCASVDGVIPPFTINQSAIPATVPLGIVTEAFVLGDVIINDAGSLLTISDADEMTLTMNVGMMSKRNLVYPTFLFGMTVSPSILVRTYDISVWEGWVSALGHTASGAGGDGTIDLHQFNMQSGERHPTNKLTLSFKVTDVGFTDFGGDGTAEASGGLTITPLWDGTNNPVLFTAVA